MQLCMFAASARILRVIELSLRERKRLSTWLALHDAAASLALSHDGLGGVTIESIVREVEVSPRTFFNYFESKEDAILGLKPPKVTERMLAEFEQSAGSYLNRVADLYVDIVLESRTGGEDRKRRFENLNRHPELFGEILAHTARVESVLTDVIVPRVPELPSSARNLTATEYVEVLVYTCSAAHRLAFRRAVASGNFNDDRALVHQALEHIQHISSGQL